MYFMSGHPIKPFLSPNTGHGIRVKGDCKNSTITISDESFSGLIKYHTRSNCSGKLIGLRLSMHDFVLGCSGL